jgi:F-type H+-transporting ATPase subunit delta
VIGQATLARPYARAAFSLALDANAIDAWAGHLRFAAQVAADPQVQAVLGNPRISAEQLLQLFLPEGEVADAVFGRFLATLIENRRLASLPEIAKAFDELKREHERVLKVVVRSATALDQGAQDSLLAALKRRFGREIELSQTIDESLIGGAVIDAGEVVIDGSVRGRLTRLAQALTH